MFPRIAIPEFYPCLDKIPGSSYSLCVEYSKPIDIGKKPSASRFESRAALRNGAPLGNGEERVLNGIF
jgi:hypothetical protein